MPDWRGVTSAASSFPLLTGRRIQQNTDDKYTVFKLLRLGKLTFNLFYWTFSGTKHPKTKKHIYINDMTRPMPTSPELTMTASIPQPRKKQKSRMSLTYIVEAA